MAIKIIRASVVTVLATTETNTPPPPPPPPEKPATEPVSKPKSLFAEALALSSNTAKTPQESAVTPDSQVLPWEINEAYTILDALQDFVNDKYPKKTLKLVHRHTMCCSYEVLGWDAETNRAVLSGGFKGGKLNPVITSREVPLYYPVWSDQ